MEQKPLENWKYVVKRYNKFALRVSVPKAVRELVGKGPITKSSGSGNPIQGKLRYYEVLFNLVKYGPSYNFEGYQSAMRGYEGLLTDEEIRAVNSFIASKWDDDILLTQSDINSRYEASKSQGN